MLSFCDWVACGTLGLWFVGSADPQIVQMSREAMDGGFWEEFRGRAAGTVQEFTTGW